MRPNLRYIVSGAVLGAILGALAGWGYHALTSGPEKSVGAAAGHQLAVIDRGKLGRLGLALLAVIRQLAELG